MAFADFLRDLVTGKNQTVKRTVNSPKVKKLYQQAMNLPKLSFAPKVAQRIERPLSRHPILRGGINMGAEMTQDILNSPQNLVEGSLKAGYGMGQAKQKNQPVNMREFLGNMGQAGEGAINLVGAPGVSTILKKLAVTGTKAVGINVLKGTAKQAIKESSQKLLPRLAKGAVTGSKWGGAYGASVGLQKYKGESSVPEQLEKTVTDLPAYIAGGAAFGTGTEALSAGLSKVIKGISSLTPKERQSGFIDLKAEIGTKKMVDILKRQKKYEGMSDAEVKALVSPKTPKQAPVVKHKNPILQTILTAQKAQSPKTFDEGKARKAVEFYHSRLGDRQMEKIYKETLAIPQQERTISLYHQKAKALLKDKKIPAWLQREIDADATIHEADPMAQTTQGKPLISQDSMNEIIKRNDPEYINSEIERHTQTPSEPIITPQKVSDMIKREKPGMSVPERISLLKSVVAPKDLVDKTSVNAHLDYLVKEAKDIVKTIERKAMGIVSKQDFVDMIEGKIKVDPKVSKYIEEHQMLTDTLHELTEDPTIGKISGNYFPHANMKLDKVIKSIMGETLLDKLNLEGGFFNERTGALKNYSKDYGQVMGDLIEQTAARKYRDVVSPLTAAEVKVKSHVEKLEPGKSMDYVETLRGSGKPKGEITYKTRAIAPGSVAPIRTENSIMEKIGQEAPDIKTTWEKLRDSKAFAEANTEKIMDMVKKGKTGTVVDFFADYLGYKGIDRSAFVSSSLTGIERVGLYEYTTGMIARTFRKEPLQAFIDEVVKYKYADGVTKEAVNTIIDDLLKTGKLEEDLRQHLLNGVTKMFSRAQIGGNLKVAMLQPTEILRIPVNYGFKNFFKGILEGFTRKSELEKKYGFNTKENSPVWEMIDKAKKEAPKSLYRRGMDKLDKVLFGPLQATENWKNQVYASAAEAKGKEVGLKGEELFHFVRSEVLAHAHPAEEFNTPMFMKGGDWGAFYRTLFQYSQFAIKNVFEMGDEVAAKNYPKAAKLLTANLTAMAGMALVTGQSLSWAIRSWFPSGPGPIVTTTSQIVEEAMGLYDDMKKGNNPAYHLANLKRLAIGNVAPGGAQFNKTSGTVDILRKGYDETPGGNIKYLAPTELNDTINGLLFGKSSLKANKAYYDQGQQTMEKTQNDQLKALPADARATYMQNILNMRKENKATQTPAGQQLKLMEKVNAVAAETHQNPSTIMDILQKKQEQSDKDALVKKVMLGGEYAGISEEDKLAALSAQGIDQTYLEGWQMRQVKSLGTADTVDYIIKGGRTDWTSLYQNDVLTPAVAKELQRKGYIRDADTLMDSLKMTDVYEQKKAIASLTKSYNKKVSTLKRKTVKSILSKKSSAIKFPKIKLPKMKTVKVKPFKSFVPKTKLPARKKRAKVKFLV